MATAGGTWLRSAGLGGLLLGVFGCGDGHLTAILPASAIPAPADECQAGEGHGAGPLPPMGWNGWNSFGCSAELDQAKFHAEIDALVDTGLRDVGYEYVNLDDCWQTGRAADGNLAVSTARFPDGIAALAQYAHRAALKLGIYASVNGCARPELLTPGSRGYEEQDAAAFASLGVDYIKYNSCGGSGVEASVRAMRAAVDATGRPMFLSVSEAPFKYWHTQVGQSWRIHADIQPSWQAILDIIDTTTSLAAYAGQGGYNDSDMLWIGNPALSEGESRAYFSAWAILASPLLAGNDLTTMSEATRSILSQRDVIALNQDALRLQGALLATQGDVMVFAKPLAQCAARGVVLLNRGEQAAEGSVAWSDLGLVAGPALVRDLWTGQESTQTDRVKVSVGPHEAVALRLVGTEAPLPRGNVYLSDLSWTYATNGWGPVERDLEVGDKAAGDGAPLSMGGHGYAKGLGTNSPSLVRFRLGKRCRELSADIGIDDSSGGAGSAVFQVWADGDKLFDSGVLEGGQPPMPIRVDVTGRSELRLWVGEVDDFGLDHADWADAQLRCDH